MRCDVQSMSVEFQGQKSGKGLVQFIENVVQYLSWFEYRFYLENTLYELYQIIDPSKYTYRSVEILDVNTLI
jgi:hypothetical protein